MVIAANHANVADMFSDVVQRIVRLADDRNLPETPAPLGYGGLSIVRAREPTPLAATLYVPLLCLVLQGAKETMFGDRAVRFATGDTLIVSLTLPTVSRVVEASTASPYVSLAVEIDVPLLRTIKAEADAAPLAEAGSAVTAQRGAPALVDAMKRLFELYDASPAERQVMTPLLLREIHFRILDEEHAGLLRQLARPSSMQSRINAIIGLLHRDPARRLSVSEMAAEASMSVSSFHEHFKAITRTTPRQFQKDLRLLAARERLASSAEQVGQVAFAVGYESSTQFSREYARKFGHPPSREARAFTDR